MRSTDSGPRDDMRGSYRPVSPGPEAVPAQRSRAPGEARAGGGARPKGARLVFDAFEEFDIATTGTTIHGRRGGDGPPVLLLPRSSSTTCSTRGRTATPSRPASARSTSPSSAIWPPSMRSATSTGRRPCSTASTTRPTVERAASRARRSCSGATPAPRQPVPATRRREDEGQRCRRRPDLGRALHPRGGARRDGAPADRLPHLRRPTARNGLPRARQSPCHGGLCAHVSW